MQQLKILHSVCLFNTQITEHQRRIGNVTFILHFISEIFFFFHLHLYFHKLSEYAEITLSVYSEQALEL